jgi:hypothetical protein
MNAARVLSDRLLPAVLALVVCLTAGAAGSASAAPEADRQRVEAEAQEVYLELTRRLEELVDEMSDEQRARASRHAAELRARARDFYRQEAESFERFHAREQEAMERMRRGEPPRPEAPETEGEPRPEPTEPVPDRPVPATPEPGPEPALPPATEPEASRPGTEEPLPEARPAPPTPRGARTSSDGTLPREDRAVLLAEGVRRFSRAMEEASREHSLRPGFLLCVMRIESAYDTGAVSRAGALGLMQLMPGTAEDLGVNPYDLRENILGGARLIDENLRLYGGDVTLAMAAYNAGRGAVEKYGGVPPYRETQDYVARVERDCGKPRP